MRPITITNIIHEYQFGELSSSDQKLINLAKESTKRSYAPYSKFSVGAAIELNNGEQVVGTNQENAAYPSGICAERTAIFYANSQFPDQPVKTLAIAAFTAGDFLELPISPCGACRQVILETERRFNQPIRILLYGKKAIYEIKTIKELLPLCFDGDSLEK